jgi:hypothetical protein
MPGKPEVSRDSGIRIAVFVCVVDGIFLGEEPAGG